MPTAAPEGVLHLGAESARRLASAARAGDVTLFAVFGGQGYAYLDELRASYQTGGAAVVRVIDTGRWCASIQYKSVFSTFGASDMRCGNECIRGNNPISMNSC